jgi:hypothetical protein
MQIRLVLFSMLLLTSASPTTPCFEYATPHLVSYPLITRRIDVCACSYHFAVFQVSLRFETQSNPLNGGFLVCSLRIAVLIAFAIVVDLDHIHCNSVCYLMETTTGELRLFSADLGCDHGHRGLETSAVLG